MKHAVMVALMVMALAVGAAVAQNYPTKTVRLVTATAGGGGDLLARLIAREVAVALGQPMVVDNRVSGLVAETVAAAAPDGYTLMLLANILWFEPLMRKTSYDPVRDFAPVTAAGVTPNVLVVHPSLPVKSQRELISLARARPNELNYATSGTGSVAELAAELFNSMAGVKVVGVPYKGASLAVNAVIGGEVQIMFATGGSVLPQVKSGRLRALAVTSAQPSALVPGLPTVAASGLPGYESVTTYAMLAPAKTPSAIIDRLNQEVLKALAQAEVKAKSLDIGIEAVGGTPQDLAARIKADMVRMGKIIQQSYIGANQR